jgi:hypothetical protein
MLVTPHGYSLEFGLNLGKVNVGSYMRGGKLVKAFTQKRMLLGQELLEASIANEGNIKNLAKGTFELTNTGKKNNLKQVANLAKSTIVNPKKAIKEGLEREALLLRTLNITQNTKVTKGTIIKSALTPNEALLKFAEDFSKNREAQVAVGGFVTSKAFSSSGIPGSGVIGDLVGSRSTRRALEDVDILKKVLSELQGDSKYVESSRLEKISHIFSKSKAIRKDMGFEDKVVLAGDVGGWSMGTLIESTLGFAPGLPGGMVATELAASVKRLSPPKKVEEAMGEVIRDQVNKGNLREAKMKEKIQNSWQILLGV